MVELAGERKVHCDLYRKRWIVHCNCSCLDRCSPGPKNRGHHHKTQTHVYPPPQDLGSSHGPSNILQLYNKKTNAITYFCCQVQTVNIIYKYLNTRVTGQILRNIFPLFKHLQVCTVIPRLTKIIRFRITFVS